MKTGHSPRLFCRIVRTYCVVKDIAPGTPGGETAAGRRSRWLDRHVAHCPDCQAYFGRAAQLDTALRAAAPAQTAPAADDLEIAVLRAVATARREPPARRLVHRPLWTLAGVAALIVAIVATVSLRRSSAPPGPARAPLVASGAGDRGTGTKPAEPAPPSSAAAPRIAPESRPGDTLAALSPVTSAIAENPLQTEAQSVYADARYAVRFLALNFLPSGLVAENGQEPHRYQPQDGG